MPRDLKLERKAHTRLVGFSHIARLQDDIARDDDKRRHENKLQKCARTRGMLDGQMELINKARVRHCRTESIHHRRIVFRCCLC